jgi:hypothetical protein
LDGLRGDRLHISRRNALLATRYDGLTESNIPRILGLLSRTGILHLERVCRETGPLHGLRCSLPLLLILSASGLCRCVLALLILGPRGSRVLALGLVAQHFSIICRRRELSPLSWLLRRTSIAARVLGRLVVVGRHVFFCKSSIGRIWRMGEYALSHPDFYLHSPALLSCCHRAPSTYQ